MHDTLIKEALSKLSRIDHISLNEFADYLEQQADLIRKIAVQNTLTPEDKMTTTMGLLEQTPRIVSRYLIENYSIKEAITKASETTGAPIEAIENAWRRFSYDKSEKSYRQRNRLLIELVNLGLSYAEVGKRLNLHPNTVSRIATKARKASYLPAPKGDHISGGDQRWDDDNVF